MKRRREVTVNLVRYDSDTTYEVVSDFDLTVMRGHYRVIPEKVRFDEKSNMHGRFYIRSNK